VKRVLVTGGCGFIGVNLAEDLLREGVAVRVLDNLSVGSRDDLAAVGEFAEIPAAGGGAARPLELVVGDIRDREAVAGALRGVDAVVHLAAQTGVIPSVEDPLLDADLNVRGTLTVLEGCRRAGVRRFVFASSNAPLGEQAPPAHEDLVPRPLSPYGASKLAGEAYCSAFHGSFGMQTVSLRFANAYGPRSRRKGSVVAVFFKAALSGRPLVIYGDGRQTRDFVHVRDLCRAIRLGLAAERGGEVFQVATGEETSVLDLAARVRGLAGRDLGRTVAVEHRPARAGEILRNTSDISKARRLLGYEPGVALDDGLRETWSWFREHWRPQTGAGA